MSTPEEEDLYKGAPLQIGDECPNFTCDSHLGMITFHEVLDGQFSMFVTFPHNFEAVATTELGQMAKLAEEFEGTYKFVEFSSSLSYPLSPSPSPSLKPEMLRSSPSHATPSPITGDG